MNPTRANTPNAAAESSGVRERLLDAAYTEVVAGRWPRMRMADIAAEAGVSRQTLYNAFGTKEGLLQAVVVREADAFLDGVMELLTNHAGDPVQAVSQATHWTLASSRENPLLRAIITGDEKLLPVLTTRAEPLHVALGERIAAFLRRNWPELGERADAVAEVSLRLTLSYVLLPTEAGQAAERVRFAVHSMFTAEAG
ncbi:TetR family transcriptional regulator [Haloactinospora alba]|uniref:TetR family transcriptional regulator n=1 Tax=Haloactinospora alba TaxID=405555 RepID=A0A543NF91_9ACTN|nr:TetR family transcriptional regulator [Haloactinospora alba]TQN30505.1 TetR family transcriptional regulator [Haloactinospora alba]